MKLQTNVKADRQTDGRTDGHRNGAAIEKLQDIYTFLLSSKGTLEKIEAI